MKYSEAEKQIKALSSKYYISMGDGDFIVNYKNMLVAWVKNNERYLFYNDEKHFKKIPFSNKLYMILAELAITPLDERVEEKKYYVKIYDSALGYLNINKTKFNDKEIEQLKKRDDIPLDWNKVSFEEAN